MKGNDKSLTQFQKIKYFDGLLNNFGYDIM